ncbi:MAG: DUF72 domain-containing protein [Acidobacteriota bacterium]
MPVYIGTSGWQYKHWAELFYPKEVPSKDELLYYADRFRIKRLKDPEEPAERFMSRARLLGKKLGPVLLQLPPHFQRDDERLKNTLQVFPRNIRITIEFRHDSWFVDEVRKLLEKFQVSLCLADRGSQLMTPSWRTADWAYIRFHGGTGSPPGCYGRSALSSRAELLAKQWGKSADLYVYFNNDMHGCALRDARQFASITENLGLKPTRASPNPKKWPWVN